MGSKERDKPRNIILIGYMGTGKTAVGRKVADSLGFQFVDTDQLIEQGAGQPITAIFEERGEAAFRDLETAVLKRAAAGVDQVISTGGGTVLREENRKIIARSGYCIWLKASADTIFNRVSGNSNRPLLKTDDPRGAIESMLIEREPHYRAVADLEITSNNLSVDEVAYGVSESARVHFAHEAACGVRS